MENSDELKEVAEVISNYKEAWKSKAARSMVWNILEQCGIYGNLFTGNSQTFFLEGKRAIGLFILEQLQEMDPTSYARLILEQRKGR